MKNSFKQEKILLLIGICLIITGVLFNKCLLTLIFPTGNGIIGDILNSKTFWIFNIICVVSGVLLAKYRYKLVKIKKRDVIFMIITFFIFIILMEGGIRLFFIIKHDINPQKMNLNNKLGWQTKPSQNSKGIIKGFGEIIYSTTINGFRVFGDMNTKKKKLLIIGDSVTQANCVSDGSTYYNYLQKHSDNIEIFAYGGGGYGTLQEFMIIDSYFDIVRPDLILWQFSANDFINNDHYLESMSYANNNKKIRPYLINEKIEYLYPTQDYGPIYKFINFFYIFKILDIRLSILFAERHDSIESELSPLHPAFIKSYTTTAQLIGKIMQRINGTPFVAFSATKPKWIGNSFENLSVEYNFYYISDIPIIIQDNKNSGIKVDGSPYDPHWNNVGHAIAGERIFDFLYENNLIRN